MNEKEILLIEDNQSDIDLTKRAFEQNGIKNKLVVIEDGQEALDYLLCEGEYSERNITELPAIILLDLKLPKVDGLDILKKIRSTKHTRLIPVAILTSSTEQQDIIASYNLGANSFINKPVDFMQFSKAVKHLGLYWLLINEPPPS